MASRKRNKEHYYQPCQPTIWVSGPHGCMVAQLHQIGSPDTYLGTHVAQVAGFTILKDA